MTAIAVHRSSIGDNERRAQAWVLLALCGAVLAAWALGRLVPNRPDYAKIFGPDWVALAAAGLAAVEIILLHGGPRWQRLQRALMWGGLLLMVWAANGLPIDLLPRRGSDPIRGRLAGSGD